MLRLPPVEFIKPASLDDVVAALSDDDVRLVAGGTDLWPNMKRRHQKAAKVVSLMGIPGLDEIRANGEISLGATVTLSAIVRNDTVRARYPGLAMAVASISSPPLRNMGTIGGNVCVDTRCTYYNQSEEWRRSIDYCLKEEGEICWVATKTVRCWAHTASDSAPMLCALGARVKLVSKDGERVIPLQDLYRNDGIDYLTRQPGEIVTEILLPADADADHCKSAFLKLRRRGSIDFGVLSVAAAVWLDDNDVVEKAAMYLGNVDSMPLRVGEAEELLVGNKLTKDLVDQVAHFAHKIAQPMDNTDFAASWRGKMAERYASAALGEIAGLPIRRPLPRHRLTVV